MKGRFLIASGLVLFAGIQIAGARYIFDINPITGKLDIAGKYEWDNYSTEIRQNNDAFKAYTSQARAHQVLLGNAHGLEPYQLFGSPATYSSFPVFDTVGGVTWQRPVETCGSDPATAIFDGRDATFRVSSTTTLPPGSPATVRNDGIPTAGVLKFGIPAGAAGAAGANGANGKPALFCNISAVIRAFGYDSAGLNPLPALQTFAVQVWVGAVQVVADSWVWWTGGDTNHVHGSATTSTFTPSVYGTYSGYGHNNFVAVQARHSSATTGRQYCTTGIPIAVTRAGIKGDKGDPGSNATVTEQAVIDAFAAASNNTMAYTASSANTYKVKFKYNGYERFGITGDGKLTHIDPAGVVRFQYDPATHTFAVFNNAGRAILKTYTTGGGRVDIGG